MSAPKSELNIVMVSFFVCDRHCSLKFRMFRQGAMTFGEAGKDGARVHDLKDVSAILDVFQKHGYREVSSYIDLLIYSLIHITLRSTLLSLTPVPHLRNFWER